MNDELTGHPLCLELLALHPVDTVVLAGASGELLWQTASVVERFDADLFRDVFLRLECERENPDKPGEYRFELAYAKSLSSAAKVYSVVARRTDEHWLISFIDRDLESRDTAVGGDENSLFKKMLAVFAHEFRNPLVACELGIDFLKREAAAAGAKTHRTLEALSGSVLQMKGLLQTLDDYHRFNRGRLKPEMVPVNLADMLQSIVASRRAAGAKHLRLELPTQPAIVAGDGAQLRQLFQNLIDNALKFSPDCGPIEVVLRAAPEQWRLSVRDSGVGMSEVTLAHLEQPFFQAAQGVSRQFGGLGLGAYISRTIADLHGGRLHYASAGEGRGSLVTLQLPALATAELPAPAPPDSEPTGQSEAAPRVAEVLIVEDQVESLRLYELALEDLSGVHVSFTASGREALDLLISRPFDLVVTDLGLPDISGHDLLVEYQNRRAEPHADFVLLTGYGSSEERHRSRQLGFKEHLVKPVSLQQLRDLVSKYTSPDEAGHESSRV